MKAEADARRPDFDPGVPVRLADGQTWQLRRPKVYWKRVWRDDVPSIVPRTSLGPEFDAALAAREAVLKGETATVAELVGANFDLASSLLRANYDLTPREVDGLLEWSQDDDEVDALWDTVVEVALGVAPKPSPGGPA